jgi:hypothetical protein
MSGQRAGGCGTLPTLIVKKAVDEESISGRKWYFFDESRHKRG